jgi:N-acetyl-gamma-glutamyl-phosphate reductase
MAARVYIDGHVGTVGLRIREWLAGRDDLSVLTLAEADRKDPAARRDALAAADVAVLCLPDDASREAAAWASGSGTPVVDASTAHRVDGDWVYGLPELAPGQRQSIARSQRVTSPGCYPQGFVLAIRPLVEAGVLRSDVPLGIHALSGYTGGGRQLIERWEDPARGLLRLPHDAPYALERVHKHVPEMMAYAGLSLEPQFLPAVGPFPCGMRVTVPLHAAHLAGASGADVWKILEQRYADEPFVRVRPLADPPETDEHSLDPRACNDTNRLDLHVLPHPSGHVALVAILDNLGKGACGSAIQCVNLLLGFPDDAALPR